MQHIWQLWLTNIFHILLLWFLQFREQKQLLMLIFSYSKPLVILVCFLTPRVHVFHNDVTRKPVYTGSLSRLYPASHPMHAGISSSPL